MLTVGHEGESDELSLVVPGANRSWIIIYVEMFAQSIQDRADLPQSEGDLLFRKTSLHPDLLVSNETI